MRYLCVLQSIYIFWKKQKELYLLLSLQEWESLSQILVGFYFKDYHLFYFTFSPNYSLSR